jgi:T5SS/PEP-CTERM-associated repeat protein
MTRENPWLRSLAGCLSLFCSTALVQAATFEWTDALSGDFNNAALWTLTNGAGTAPPGPGDLTEFNEVGAYEVTFNTDRASTAMTLSAGDVTFRGGLKGQTYNLTTGTADAAISGGNLDLGVAGASLSLNIGDRLFVRDGSLGVNFASDVTAAGIVTVGTAINDGIITVDNSSVDFGNTVQLGLNGNSGTLTLQNGSAGNIDGTTQLGLSAINNTGGFLNVLSGSTLTAGSLDVGQVSSATGQQAVVTVDGAGSMLTQSGASTLVVGEFGNNNIQAELHVTGAGVFNTGSGAVTIQQTGLLDVSTGGTFNANGSLAVQSGATLVFDGGVLNANAGLNASSGVLDFRDGALTVTGGAFVPNAGGPTDDYSIDGPTAIETPHLTIGAGATATIGRDLFVGNVNQGELTIQNGGQVDTGGELKLGGAGTLNITGGTLNATGAVTMATGSSLTLDGGSLTAAAGLDNSAGGTLDFRDGTLTVTGGVFAPNAGGPTDDFSIDGPSAVELPQLTIGAGASASIGRDLSVGGSNQGRLTIENGGTVSNAAGQVGTGTVIVDGAGSTWTNSGNLLLGGSFNSGTLTIQNGGSVSNASVSIIGSSSSATIDGVGSTWTNSSSLILNGSTLNITNGGTVSSASGSLSDSIDSSLTTVDGAGSTWTITSTFLQLGIRGTLNITNGGTITNARSGIGNTFGGTGTVAVAGVGSTWIHTGKLSAINGTLDITTGGAVSNADGEVVGGLNETGIVTVNGAGSTWTNTGTLSVGGTDTTAGGTGILNIQDSGFVQADSTFKIWTDGTVNLAGGTLELNGPLQEGGGTLNFTAGVMNVNDATQLLVADSGDKTVGDLSMGSTFALNTGQTINLAGIARVDFGGQLRLGGGTLTSASLLVQAGGTVVNNAGSSTLTSPVLALAGSSTNVTGGDLTLGDASAFNGFASAGTTNVGNNILTLLDANDAVFDSFALVTLGDGLGGAGTLTAANGLTLNFGGNVAGFGTVNTPNDPFKPFINNGNITGNSPAEPITLTGYVKGVGTLNNVVITGTDAPGFSPASVYRGSVAYAGELQIEVGGLSEGSFDIVNHAGTATLGGTLDLSLINGFTPSENDTFQFLTASNILGTFDTILGADLGGGLAFDVIYNLNDVTLEVISTALAGDLDGDGFVGISDLNIVLGNWNQNVPPANPLADPSGDGFIGIADLNAVLGNWNAGTPPGTIANIPEPGTLVVMGLFGTVMLRRSA